MNAGGPLMHPSLQGIDALTLPARSTRAQIAAAMLESGARIVLLVDDDGFAFIRSRTAFVHALTQHKRQGLSR